MTPGSPNRRKLSFQGFLNNRVWERMLCTIAPKLVGKWRCQQPLDVPWIPIEGDLMGFSLPHV